MAGTIKGITVKIGGDTVDLGNSLKDVEKISKSLQSELNLVNKQLKFDPSNSVLLAQKQEILEEKIETTKESLKKLESVQEQVEEQAQSGDLGADKYRAYQREVEATKRILKNLESQLDDAKEAQNKFENEVKGVNLSSGTQEVKDLKDEVGNLDDKAKKTDLSNLKKEMDNVKSSANELKDTLKDTATEVGAGIAAAGGVAAGAVMSFDSVESALNHIQAQTGKTNEEMDGLETVLENIYNGNYGEDMQDIANVMATVAQETKETDPSKIQQMTESLFTLKDTFGFDYAETIRANKMLMDQFSISSEEAFNLIVQGAQNGLNKNGDLLDTINEYAVHYKQQGYSAEEFFNSLENGAASGTFSVDKLGDAMKEFGIRTKDTATTTTEGFELLGLDADKMREAFAKGGESAREATQEVLEQLFSLDDEVARNQAGVDLFGTMWEDLGEEGVKALMDVSGSADLTKESMESIKDIEYDDVGNKLEVIGRKAQTEIINPLVKKSYPKIKNGIEWVSNHLDDLLPIIEGLGKQAAIVWGVKKANEVTKGVINLISSYKALTAATDTATNAQKGLNSAQKANVISAIITGVLTLVNAIDTYNETKWENSSLKEEIDEVNELTEEWKDLADEMASKTEEINETELSLKVDFETVDKMKERLQEIIEDGTIDENEKGEYQTIIDLLSEKVDGFESNWNSLTLKKVDGKIVIKDNIDDVNQRLDELVENWEITQAKLTFTETYSEIQTEISLKEAEINALDIVDLEESKQELIDYIYEKSNLSKEESKILSNEILEQKGDFDKAIDSLNKKFKSGKLSSEKYANLYYDTMDSAYSSTNRLFGFNDFNHEATKRIKEYTDAIVENDDAIESANSELNSLKETSEAYSIALQALNGGQVDYSDLIKLSTEYGLSHEAVLSLVKDKGITSWDELVEKSKSASDEIITNASEAGKETPISFANGINETIDEAAIAAGQVAITAKNNLDFDSSSTGSQLGIDFADALERTNPNASNAAASIREAARSGFGDTYAVGKSKGNDYGEGFVEGINEKVGKAILAGANIAISALKGTQEAQDSHSPAKKSRFLGNDNGDGFVLGVMDKIKDSFSAGKKIAKAALSGESYSADTVLSDFKLPNIDISSALSSAQSLKTLTTTTPASSSKLTKNITNAPVINVAVNGTQISNDYDIHKLADKVSAAIAEQITNDGMKWG